MLYGSLCKNRCDFTLRALVIFGFSSDLMSLMTDFQKSGIFVWCHHQWAALKTKKTTQVWRQPHSFVCLFRAGMAQTASVGDRWCMWLQIQCGVKSKGLHAKGLQGQFRLWTTCYNHRRLFVCRGEKKKTKNQKTQTHALTVNLEEEIAKSAACSLLFVGRGSFVLCLRRSNVCQKEVLSV